MITYPLARKNLEARRIMNKYPDRIAIIITSKDFELDKNKYLCPRDLTVGHFQVILRKRIKLKAEQAMFMLVKSGAMLTQTTLLSSVYSEHKDKDDDFLYITLISENVFG